VWSDMLGSLGVIVAALVIYFTGWVWVDTLIAVAIGLWVLPRTWMLLKESINILLEGTPEGISLDEVQAAIAKVDGVTGVHDLHVWALTSGKNSLTVHVVHALQVLPADIIAHVQELVADRFKVFHTTIQCELVACAHSDDGCNFVDRRESGHEHLELARVDGLTSRNTVP
jgi:cobalt-zinc-cadmium efflux system protein